MRSLPFSTAASRCACRGYQDRRRTWLPPDVEGTRNRRHCVPRYPTDRGFLHSLNTEALSEVFAATLSLPWFILGLSRQATSWLQEEGSCAESIGNPISRYGEETAEPVRGSFDSPSSHATYPLTPRTPQMSGVLVDVRPTISADPLPGLVA